MGVTCTAFEHVRLVEAGPYEHFGTCRLEEEYELRNRVFLARYAFDRSDGLPDGLYEISGRTASVDHSYLGYNAFREQICRIVLEVEPRVVWDAPEDFAGRAFVDWIHFADNEGFLGPRTCSRLAANFQFYRPAIEARMDDPWLMGQYDRWVEVLGIAADTGVVRYS